MKNLQEMNGKLYYKDYIVNCEYNLSELRADCAKKYLITVGGYGNCAKLIVVTAFDECEACENVDENIDDIYSIMELC